MDNQKLFNDHQFNWEKIQSHINKLGSIEERIIYLSWLLNEHKIFSSKELPLFFKLKDDFVNIKIKLERELNKQDNLLKLSKINLSEESNDNISASSKDPTKDHLTIQEAADYLNVSISTMYKYTHQNILPYTKPTGKKVYFKIDDLAKFLESKRNKSNSEIEELAINYVYNKHVK